MKVTVVKENKLALSRELRQGTRIADMGINDCVIGIAGQDMDIGEQVIIHRRKGPAQLIWPDDGKEITITAEEKEK